MTVDYRVGDTREVIKTIPDGSVDLIASSPPFLALRSYVPADHHAKADEIGSEANPAEFIDMLLGLTAEWGRVLAPHGSIAIELGDTYAGSGGVSDTSSSMSPALLESTRSGTGPNKKRTGQGMKYERTLDPAIGAHPISHVSGTPGAGNGPGWPRAKSLALIPQLYAVALAYGINPLTGLPSPAGRWLVRNVVVWHRPNPAVGALGDKVRPSTSYIVVATRSPKRWFDLTAVRTAHQIDPARRVTQIAGDRASDKRILGAASGDAFSNEGNPAGAPPLDAWFDEPDSDLRPRRIAMRDHRRRPDIGPEPATLTTYIVIATRSPKRWFDLTAVRGPSVRGSRPNEINGTGIKPITGSRGDDGKPLAKAEWSGSPPLDAWFDAYDGDTQIVEGELSGPVDAASPAPSTPSAFDPYDGSHDTWTLTTQPSRLAHYAMWPAKLAERLVLSMCPREVCRVCGEPRRRVEERDTAAMMLGARSVQVKGGTREERGGRITPQHNGFHIDARLTTTIGWTDCGCQCPKCGDGKEVFVGEPHHRPDCDCLWDETPCAQTVEPCPDCLAGNYRPGLTLDPFAGTGTTLAVADLHGRDAIGIDFDARNKAIYPARYDEVKKALFGTPAPMPGQGDLFAEEVPA